MGESDGVGQWLEGGQGEGGRDSGVSRSRLGGVGSPSVEGLLGEA